MKKALTGTALVAVAVVAYLFWPKAETATATQQQETAEPVAAEPPPPTPVRIGVIDAGVRHAPFFVAHERGTFGAALDSLNATPTLVMLADLAAAQQAIAAGDVDLVVADASVSLGAGVVRRGVVSVDRPLSVLVREASGIDTMADLAGGGIAGDSLLATDYAQLAIDEAGLDSDAFVPFVYTTSQVAVDMYEAGATDALLTMDPAGDIAAIGPNTPLKSVAIGVTEGGREVVVFVRSAFEELHPEVVAATSAVIEDARAWAASNPDEAKRLTAAGLGQPQTAISGVWSVYDWQPPPALAE